MSVVCDRCARRDMLVHLCAAGHVRCDECCNKNCLTLEHAYRQTVIGRCDLFNSYKTPFYKKKHNVEKKNK